MHIEALERVSGSWNQRVAALTPQQWVTPTRLPGWTVQDLVAHVAPDAQVLDFLRGERVQPPAVNDAAQWLRIFNEPDGPAHTMADDLAEQAQQAAGVGPAALVANFADYGPAMLAELRAADPTTGLAHPVLGSVSFRAIADTATMEATVHLLDLIDAIGGAPVPDAALEETAKILSAVADSVAFIEAATGRSQSPVLPVVR